MITQEKNIGVDYYSHPYVSNSDLTKFKNNGKMYCSRDILDFGNLVHALVLEPRRVDLIKKTLDGNPVTDIENAMKMKSALMKDSFCSDFIARCSTEVEMYNPNTPFEYNGVRFAIDTRRKYDLWDYATKLGGDLKTTGAETQEEFLKEIESLDYDRARVFYAKGSGADRDVIIGVSKTNYKVFKVFLAVGSRLWEQGKDKMNELAYKYWQANVPF